MRLRSKALRFLRAECGQPLKQLLLRPRMLRLYRRYISAGDLCFDVGANVGQRTDIFLRLGARVVAIEPNPQCADVIERRYGDSALLTVVKAAVGESHGTGVLRLGDTSTLSTMSSEWQTSVMESARFAGHTWDKSIEVPVVTLDELVSTYGRPAFVKVDVEGFELHVIRGLSRPLPMMSLEFTPECWDSSREAMAHVDALGATLWNVSLGESMTLELDEWTDVAGVEAHLYKAGVLSSSTVFGDIYALCVEC